MVMETPLWTQEERFSTALGRKAHESEDEINALIEADVLAVGLPGEVSRP
jgi:hypothetical protein